MKKRAWTEEEDAALKRCMFRSKSNGRSKWKYISASMAEMNVVSSGKRCRERLTNHLHDSINHDALSSVELHDLKRLFQENGRKWSTIAKKMQGRTANFIKNKVTCLLRRGWEDVAIPLSSTNLEVLKAFEEVSPNNGNGIGKITFSSRKTEVLKNRKCIGVFDEHGRLRRLG